MPNAIEGGDPTADIIDGARIVGGPGAVEPPVGVVVVTNLDSTDPPVAEPVQPDGSFSVVIDGSPTDVRRVQAREGGARSVPLDVVGNFMDSTLTTPERPFEGCLVLEPGYEVDFFEVSRGETAQARVRLTNTCGVTLTFEPPRLRTPGPFVVTEHHRGLEGGADLFGGAASWEREQHHVAAVTFDEGPERSQPFAHHQVAFPVSGHRPVIGFGGSFGDHDRVADLAFAGRVPFRARVPHRPSAAQTLGELVAQSASGLDEQRQIDRFVGHPHLRFVRVLCS